MKNCEFGCAHYTCGSIRHIKECVNYPESLAELFDDSKAENKKLKFMIDNGLGWEDMQQDSMQSHIN